MDKIKVNLKINDYKINETGIIDNDVIKITKEDTKLEYNLKNNILTRENNDMKQVINFKEQYFTYKLKEIPSEISEKINLISLTNQNKQVNIIYQIGEDIFYLNLNYETI